MSEPVQALFGCMRGEINFFSFFCFLFSFLALFTFQFLGVSIFKTKTSFSFTEFARCLQWRQQKKNFFHFVRKKKFWANDFSSQASVLEEDFSQKNIVIFSLKAGKFLAQKLVLWRCLIKSVNWTAKCFLAGIEVFTHSKLVKYHIIK